MAGRARRAALADELDRRAREWADWRVGDAEPSHLDFVCAWIEDRKYVNALVDEMAKSTKLEITYSLLMAHLNDKHGKETVEVAMRESRARASHSIAERVVQVVEAKAVDNVDVSRAASQSRSLQWQAEKYNRKDYGQEKGVNVAISIGGLHLDALRARPAVAVIVAPSVSDNTPLHTVESQPLVNAGDSQAA